MEIKMLVFQFKFCISQSNLSKASVFLFLFNFLILCNKEPEDFDKLGLAYSRGIKGHLVLTTCMEVWMIGSLGSRVEEELGFIFCPVDSLWSQMYSGWSLVLFGLVTTFNKEVLDLV